jgi:hypothetical protein
VETADINELTVARPPIMLGDMAPFSTVRQFPGLGQPPTPFPGRPPLPGVPRIGTGNRFSAALPWVRGFKIADNMSPRPQDRFFFTFDYFNDLNGDVNRRLGNQVSNLQAYRYLFGFEKTFLDGNASIGIRMPLNTLTATSQVPALGGTSTAVGNLTVFSKFILWQDPSQQNLISSGVAITVPNGPSRFAGSPATAGFHDSQIQPFIGYIFQQGRFYVQGFEAVDVPFNGNDVTMLYNDVGIGYFLYRSADPNAFLTGIVPTFETHVNVPLNHQGALRINDPAGTPNVVDLTLGTSLVFGRRAILTAAFIDPVTGPKPFDFEVVGLLNIFFGRTRNAVPPITPPGIGM